MSFVTEWRHAATERIANYASLCRRRRRLAADERTDQILAERRNIVDRLLLPLLLLLLLGCASVARCLRSSRDASPRLRVRRVPRIRR